MDLKLGAIGQIARAVPDLAEAERFYRDVLGLQHLFTTPKLAFFDCGGVTFTGDPHMIFRHPDGTEEWLTFFEEPGGALLSLISQVAPGK